MPLVDIHVIRDVFTPARSRADREGDRSDGRHRRREHARRHLGQDHRGRKRRLGDRRREADVRKGQGDRCRTHSVARRATVTVARGSREQESNHAALDNLPGRPLALENGEAMICLPIDQLPRTRALSGTTPELSQLILRKDAQLKAPGRCQADHSFYEDQASLNNNK